MHKNLFFDKPSALFARIKLIFRGFAALPLIFFFLAFLHHQQKNAAGAFDESYFVFAVPAVGLCMVFLAYLFFLLKRKEAAGQSLREKLAIYYRAKVGQTGLLTAAALFTAGSYFLSGSPALIYWFGLMWILLLINRPKTEALSREMNLSAEEEESLERDFF